MRHVSTKTVGWVVGSRSLSKSESVLLRRHLADSERERRTVMRKLKQYRVCIGKFDALLSRSDLEPEQRDAIKAARRAIKDLSRMRDPDEADVFRCISDVSEKLLKTFRKHK